MRLTRPLLQATSDAASQVLRLDAPADRKLSAFFRSQPKLGHFERGVIAETVYAILRRRRHLEWALGHATPRQLVLATLSETHDPAVLSDLVGPKEARWLHELATRESTADDLPLGVELELPDWVVEALSQTMASEMLRKLAQALSEPAPIDLRVNELRIDRDTALSQLASFHIQGEPTPYSPLGIRLRGKPVIHRCPLFVDGSIEIQDEGSQLIGYLVSPLRGEMVVDFCAGAGGKTLALAAMMRSTGRVYAFDNDEKRLTRFKPRLARSGLSNVHPQRVDGERDPRIGRLAGKIDRVLVDAPCSGLGTLRRNPDLKWRHSLQTVEELHAKQLSIVNSAARLVKPGGRLVYATCSLLPRENEAVVEAFLTNSSGFRVVDAYAELAKRDIKVTSEGAPYLKLYPHIHHTDGFFAAVLERSH